MFSLDRISFTDGYVLATASALPSVEALSTTTISISAAVGLAKIDSRHSSKCWRVFQLTMMIESIMGLSPQFKRVEQVRPSCLPVRICPAPPDSPEIYNRQ